MFQVENSAHESTLIKEYMFGCLTNHFSLDQHRVMSRFTRKYVRNSKEHLHIYGSSPPVIRYTPTGSLLMAGPDEVDALLDLSKDQG